MSAPYSFTRGSGARGLERFEILPVSVVKSAMAEEMDIRFGEIDIPHITHGTVEEPGIQEMHHRVFHAAGVLIDRCPAVGDFPVEWVGSVLRAEVAHVVPGRVHERVHSVCLALARYVAVGARCVQELLVLDQR